MSISLNVSVRQYGVELEVALARPVRVTPVGVSGVVYGKVVYPLHEGPSIDLDDAPFEKDQCDTYVANRSEIVYARTGVGRSSPTLAQRIRKWNVENSKYGNYFVFDAGEQVAQEVASALKSTPLGVRRFAASYRPASDGHFYDWFVRLKFDGALARVRQDIADLLGVGEETSGLHSPAGEQSREVERLKQQIASLDADRTAAEERVHALVLELNEIGASADAKISSLNEDKALLARTVKALEGRVKKEESLRAAVQRRLVAAEASGEAPRNGHGDLAMLEQELHDYRELLEDADAREKKRDVDLDEAMTEWNREARESALLRHEVESLKRQLSAIQDAETEREVAIANGWLHRDDGADSQLRTFLTQAMPRLTLCPNGFKELRSLKNAGRVLENLLLIDRNPRANIGKLFRNTKGISVWEVDDIYIGDYNGNSQMGRIYYWVASRSRILVDVHHKNGLSRQQARVDVFVNWCKGWDPEMDG